MAWKIGRAIFQGQWEDAVDLVVGGAYFEALLDRHGGDHDSSGDWRERWLSQVHCPSERQGGSSAGFEDKLGYARTLWLSRYSFSHSERNELAARSSAPTNSGTTHKSDAAPAAAKKALKFSTEFTHARTALGAIVRFGVVGYALAFDAIPTARNPCGWVPFRATYGTTLRRTALWLQPSRRRRPRNWWHSPRELDKDGDGDGPSPSYIGAGRRNADTGLQPPNARRRATLLVSNKDNDHGRSVVVVWTGITMPATGRAPTLTDVVIPLPGTA